MYVNFKAFLRQLQVGGSITERLVCSFTSLNSAALLHIKIWPNTVLFNWRPAVQRYFPQQWVVVRYLLGTYLKRWIFLWKEQKLFWTDDDFISVLSRFSLLKEVSEVTKRCKTGRERRNLRFRQKIGSVRLHEFSFCRKYNDEKSKKIKMALVLGLWWSFQQVNTCFYGSCLCLDLNCGLLVSEVTTYPTQRYVCHNIVLGIPFWFFAFTYKTL